MLNFIIRVALLACVLSFLPGAAQAQTKVEAGRGLICDTAEQATKFVTDFNGDTQQTLMLVNGGTNACDVRVVAFIRGQEVGQVRNRQGSFSVVQILVVAIDGIRVTPAPQYTLFPIKEERA